MGLQLSPKARAAPQWASVQSTPIISLLIGTRESQSYLHPRICLRRPLHTIRTQIQANVSCHRIEFGLHRGSAQVHSWISKVEVVQIGRRARVCEFLETRRELVVRRVVSRALEQVRPVVIVIVCFLLFTAQKVKLDTKGEGGVLTLVDRA